MKRPLKLIMIPAVLIAYVIALVYIPNTLVVIAAGIPVGVVISNLIHELAHLGSYLLFGMQWKRMQVGMLTFEMSDGKLRCCWEDCSVFRGECACAYDASIEKWKYVVALLSGGLLCGAISAVLFLCACHTVGAVNSLLFSFGIAFACNAALNLLTPFSGDIRLIRTILREGK